MEIQLTDKYTITSDEHNLILNTTHVAKTGKNVGEVTYKAIGYYSTMAGLLAGLRHREIRLSQATTLDELLGDVGVINKRLAEL